MVRALYLSDHDKQEQPSKPRYHIGGPSARGKFPEGEAKGNRVLKVSRGAGAGSPLQKQTWGSRGREPPCQKT